MVSSLRFMEVLYDTQIFETQRVGGISRSFLELIKFFRKSGDIKVDFPIVTSENIYLKEVDFLKNVKQPKQLLGNFLGGIRFPGRGRLYRYFYLRENKKNIIEGLKKKDFDVFHPTYYNPYFLKYIGNKPFVLTVYDMTHEIYAKDMSRFDFSAKNKEKLLKRASKIIAISQNTKKDLIKFYNIPKEKIEVIYLATSLAPIRKKPKDAPELPKEYILFVGGREGYKNFNLFVKSIVPLLQKDKELSVVCAGQAFSKEEEMMFKDLGIMKQIKHYFINDSTLSYMYQNALCFVFPSLYEGFGIPTLESFSCGCPVVLSNASCMSEIGGDAAAYFDPSDSSDILKTIGSVVNSVGLRRSMVGNGYRQLKKFSWQKCAKETASVYESVLG